MAHAPPKELIRTEMDATLERFGRYVTGTRYDRRRKLRASTARLYENMMRHVFEWKGAADVSVDDAKGYMAHLSDGFCTSRTGAAPADSTKRSAFYALKAFFEYKRQALTPEQEREFLVPPTPRNAREAPLTMDRIHELLSRIPDRRRYAIIRVLLATGIRRAELAALKVKHVDFQARKLWIPEIGEDGRAAAKGGNGGWVCISDVALDAIREHLTSRALGADPESPVFESLQTQGHLTPDAVSGLVGDLTFRVLGKRVTPHDLRHAFASHAAAGGDRRPPMPIMALQKQLRHKNKETTLRYVHAVENLQDAYERSAPVF